MSYVTHDEIGEIVRDRLKGKGYDLAFANMIDAGVGEQPDCLGIDNAGFTILIEAKVSRSDFKADQKKPWRKDGNGIGKRRVYVTPVGLLEPKEIPYGWELWEIQDNKRKTIKIVKGMTERKVYDKSVAPWPRMEKTYHHMDEIEYNHFSKTDDYRTVVMMLSKIFRRMSAHGLDIDYYSKGGILFGK